jgi:hypothetical protein
MNSLYQITTSTGKTYQRTAWTGGDTPDKLFPVTPDEQALVMAFLNESISLCGGLNLWECAGTSAQDRFAIFQNRATLDAWRTLHP